MLVPFSTPRPALRFLLPLIGSFALCALPARSAFAQGIDAFGAYGHDKQSYESPQDFAFEVRFGPYLPRVDDEFGSGATPFATMFGTKNRYMLAAEFDWQALRIPYLGTLGPGFGLGYTTMSGKTFLTDGVTRATQEASLSLLPVYVAAVLRADVIAKKTPIPLVPYAKLGLGASLWWTSDGSGVSRVGNTVGRGTSYGYQYALGGMLLLDVFDPSAALELDSTLGVNNSYLFFEYYNSNLDGFGSGNKMQVGARTWFLGLAWEI
jgi:hypothetical protein